MNEHPPLETIPRRPLNKKKLIIWIVVLAILAAALTIWFVRNGMPFFGDKGIKESITTELNPADFQSWVVYNNQTLGIQVEVPHEWSIDEERDTENQPTGVITFNPSASAGESPSQKIVLTVGKTKEGMTNAEEFNSYKNSGQFSQPIAGYSKLGTTPTKNGEALIFQKDLEGSFELLGWYHNNSKNVFIETVNSDTQKEEAILLLRYILSSVVVL